MSSEMRGRGGGGGDGGNLHLKKELTQIRKAATARVLRDPGTSSSSWRSPINSARSAAAKHYYYHCKNDFTNHQYISNGNENHSQSQLPNIGLVDNNNNGISTNSRSFSINYEANGDINNIKEKDREKKVYLYNWKMQKSESERSRQCGDDDDLENCGNDDMKEEGEESVENSLSDARNAVIDSKSDKYGSMIFKGKDMNFTPSIGQGIKKKWKKGDYSSSVSRNYGENLKEQILLARGSKRALEGLGWEDMSSLVDQSDDTEDYCNLEGFRRASAVSPLLVKLKNKNRTNSSAAKLVRSSRKEDSSYSYSTPARSVSSYNRFIARYPSTVGSWDATTVSLNDGDDEVDDPLDLPGRSGCGIPCYWSRRSTPKYKGGSGSCFSPSLSDTLRRTGSTILCRSHRMYKRSLRESSLAYKKRRPGLRAAAQGLRPLLTNGGDGQIGSSIGTNNSDDELSTNYGELDLEALNRLDGRRWSTSCQSQEGLELVALTGKVEEGTPENIRSLSQKYRPMFFEEVIGQNIVVQSLTNAVSRKRIAPVYLFQGPRGTGKTSTARVFAAALNCLASKETKPCGVCRECAEFVSGKSKDLVEVDGDNKKGIDSIMFLLKTLWTGSLSDFSQYRVFVVNECHLLSAKTWMALLKFLEEPPQQVVLILITTDLEKVPRTVLSRCQKYLFNKIRDGDMLARLRKIAAEENLDVESDALDVIALNADGSLRDAEIMLDQLSLLRKRITTSLVHELVGVVSDEKLLELLELAMSSDTAETVKRARELMDSGVDPIVLMSQMATLIMDIIAGTYPSVDAKDTSSLFGGRSSTDAESERLKRALKLLSDAEKQLRVSSERSTWFTATLLQLGSISSPDQTRTESCRRQSSKATEDDPSSTYKDSSIGNQKPDPQYALRMSGSPTYFHKAVYRKSSSKEVSLSLMDEGFGPNSTQNQSISADALAGRCHDFVAGKNTSKCTASSMLDDIWVKCVEKCHSKTLRQLLHTYGSLVSIADVKGVFVAYIAFGDSDIKTRAERFHSSITNSFETALRSNVEVRIVLLPDGDTYLSNLNTETVHSLSQKPMNATNTLNREDMAILSSSRDGYSNLDTCQESLKISRGSFIDSEDKLPANDESSAANANMSTTKERKPEVPVLKRESIIRDQRLETAWLQAMEKGTPGSTSRWRPEKNQVLPQEGIYQHIQLQSTTSADLSSQHWEDELSHDIKSLKVDDGTLLKKDQISKRVDRYPMSPSLLHDNNLAGYFSKENLGYESGPGGGGCSGLFCWNNRKPPRRAKVRPGTPVRSHKGVRFSLFGECAKAPRTESRFRI